MRSVYLKKNNIRKVGSSSHSRPWISQKSSSTKFLKYHCNSNSDTQLQKRMFRSYIVRPFRWTFFQMNYNISSQTAIRKCRLSNIKNTFKHLQKKMVTFCNNLNVFVAKLRLRRNPVLMINYIAIFMLKTWKFKRILFKNLPHEIP